MRAYGVSPQQPALRPASDARPRVLSALLALAAGAGTMAGFHLFWQSVGGPWCAPLLVPFGRSPDDLAGLLMPLFGGFVAASFDRRGWWWIGQGLAFPAVWGLHTLFLTGIEVLYHRPPTLAEEGRFLLTEGHRLLAGFIGSYLGALSQRE